MAIPPITELPPLIEMVSSHEYVIRAQDCLEQVHEEFQKSQLKLWQADNDEALLFVPGDMVWLQSRRLK